MSEDKDAEMMCCASCGIAECDGIKLKKCTACKSVRYCGVNCQKNHCPKHKKECKKRAAELRDELLFKQPEGTFPGDCPICMIPLPIDLHCSNVMTCCSKVICSGCCRATMMSEIQEKLDLPCPFCRTPMPWKAEMEGYIMKRVDANDPVALEQMGTKYYKEGDYSSAFEYYTKAARLGDVEAHCQLAIMYEEKQGVEKDKKKELYHLEQAAIGGHSRARYNLGCHEGNSGRMERAIKHFIIAANQGHDGAIEVLRGEHARGRISKENFAAALRAHQAAVDATKSPQREAAEEFYRNLAEDC